MNISIKLNKKKTDSFFKNKTLANGEYVFESEKIEEINFGEDLNVPFLVCQDGANVEVSLFLPELEGDIRIKLPLTPRFMKDILEEATKRYKRIKTVLEATK